jgi:hypothetical protein
MPPKHRADESAFASTERIMQTFRLPRELVTFLKDEATRGGRDLTSHVMRWLEGITTWFGLPMAATALLEADREALGLERFEYVLHVLFQRSLELREKRVGRSTRSLGSGKLPYGK